ncbi:MAG: peptidylprolyl isomerase [Rhodocyclaceae bacterium]|jgi:peptidyl-prolyl cis-trans isomerase SurA|nr:peptidylprolyl isomerase [Rhodocyclaceae bacterium]
MRRYAMKCLLRSLFLLAPLLATAAPIDADRIVAVVNNEAITMLELTARVANVERQFSGQGQQLPPKAVLQRQVLDRLIVERAQIQFAQETGLEVSDEELDTSVRRIAEDNRLSVADFRAALERDGVSWRKFREEVRGEIVVGRLRDRDVTSRVTVSDGEIDNYLANVAAGADPDVQLEMAHIIIAIPEQPSSEQLMQLSKHADQVLARLKAGEDFAQVATATSESPDALKGGILGARSADRLPAIYAEAAQKLKPGEISPVLRSPAGFHIVKLIDRHGGVSGLPALRQTHARHILIRINEVVSDADARHKLDALRERLVNGADFAELARLYSNDLSAAKGGDLGWLYQGDTVPDFERTMDALKIGEYSQPVKSPFGYHLIQVLGRRTDEGSPERKRRVARQALQERKAAETYDDWLRQLRDRAYVEYKLDE